MGIHWIGKMESVEVSLVELVCGFGFGACTCCGVGIGSFLVVNV